MQAVCVRRQAYSPPPSDERFHRSNFDRDAVENDGDDVDLFERLFDKFNGQYSQGPLAKRPPPPMWGMGGGGGGGEPDQDTRPRDGRGELSYAAVEVAATGDWGLSHDNRFGCAGYVWDPFLKIYHVKNRAYDPHLGGIGRWLQQDPLGYLAGDANLHRYSWNQPRCSGVHAQGSLSCGWLGETSEVVQCRCFRAGCRDGRDQRWAGAAGGDSGRTG